MKALVVCAVPSVQSSPRRKAPGQLTRVGRPDRMMRRGGPRATLAVVPRYNPLERRMTKFMRKPPSVRAAAGVIVTATSLVVVGGGILIRVLDPSEYSSIWLGMWWSLQTVTTVGYGDVTPAHWSGRIVAAFVMLEGIAFLAITTAVITSTFVARAEQERHLADQADDAAVEARLESRLDELDRRFDTIEGMLRDLGKE